MPRTPKIKKISDLRGKIAKKFMKRVQRESGESREDFLFASALQIPWVGLILPNKLLFAEK